MIIHEAFFVIITPLKMAQHTTNSILMVRPVGFTANPQTAVNNFYQNPIGDVLPSTINAKAQQEFDAFVARLKAIGVHVIVVEDTPDPETPDAVFPNNWVSFHENGDVGIYPMFAPNRRLERREAILETLETDGFKIEHVIDYSSAEDDGVFLEGTGSVVLDRAHGKAYCALSPRADEELFIEFCEDFEFTPVVFSAYQTVEGQRKTLYHTNVMLSVAETFALICPSAIDDKKERKMVLKHLKDDGKAIITITEAQSNAFSGNALQVIGANNKRYLVMSTAAYKALTKDQVLHIEKHCEILYSPLETIETYGGGSARCMLAEVFLPKAD